jgi:hypothetical protein
MTNLYKHQMLYHDIDGVKVSQNKDLDVESGSTTKSPSI